MECLADGLRWRNGEGRINFSFPGKENVQRDNER